MRGLVEASGYPLMWSERWCIDDDGALHCFGPTEEHGRHPIRALLSPGTPAIFIACDEIPASWEHPLLGRFDTLFNCDTGKLLNCDDFLKLQAEKAEGKGGDDD